MSRISLSSLKYAAWRSEETNCFSAVVCLDGMPMFNAENDGHGGADHYSPLPKTTHGPDFRAAYGAVEEIARAESPQHFDGESEPSHGYSLGMECVVGDLVEAALALRDLRRTLKSKFLFRIAGDKAGEFRTIALKAGPVDAIVSQIERKYPGAVILNRMPEAEALAVYRGQS